MIENKGGIGILWKRLRNVDFLPLIAASCGVTLLPGRCPPIPGFVPCPILISIASEDFRFSSVTLYLFGIYSKIYL